MATLKMSSRRRMGITLFLLLGVGVLLVGCDASETPTPIAAAACPECPAVTCPEPVSYQDLWESSAHADSRSEAFTHWDEEDPPEIPIECAKCHSRPGYVDFVGVDGTEAGIVDHVAKVGTTVTCFVCHNEASADWDDVLFPSGAKIYGLGAVALCVECHQGQSSGATVDDAVAAAGMTDDDVASAELAFVNSHSISGATVFGAETQSAYEYDGQAYRGRFTRGDDFFACIECHDQHSLELQIESCHACHTIGKDDPKAIRVDTTDYDGDGDTAEGMAGEIETLSEALYAAIQDYARNALDVPLVFEPSAYPYFFVDIDDDGEVDPDEAVFPNRYGPWTPRMLRAAYNLNYAARDPGAYAHNPDYVIQALYDSLVDIGGDAAGMMRPAVYSSEGP